MKDTPKPEIPPKNIPHKQNPVPSDDNPINPKEDVPKKFLITI